MKNLNFKSLYLFLESAPTEENCRKYFESIRWKDGIECPHCLNREKKIYRFKKEFAYKCPVCKKQFSLTKGTLFERTHIGLKKWFTVIYQFLSHKKGVSSHQLSRDLGITQPNAWFMLHRIHRAMYNRKERVVLEGIVEIDETFVGGKNKNRHYKDRKPHSQGRCTKYKAPVVGMLQRN